MKRGANLGDLNLEEVDLYTYRLPRWLSSREPACQCRKQGLTLGREDVLERKWQPTTESLPGKFHGHRSLHGVTTSRTRLSD